MALNYYEQLGIEPTATVLEIKAAIRQAEKLTHPDSPWSGGGDAKDFNWVQEAKEILLDPEKRASYDYRLKQKQTVPPSEPSPGQRQRSSRVDDYIDQERANRAQAQKPQRDTTGASTSPPLQHETSVHSRLGVPLVLALLVWYVVDHNPITRPLGGYPCDAISILLTVALYKWRTTVKVIKRFHKSKEN